MDDCPLNLSSTASISSCTSFLCSKVQSREVSTKVMLQLDCPASTHCWCKPKGLKEQLTCMVLSVHNSDACSPFRSINEIFRCYQDELNHILKVVCTSKLGNLQHSNIIKNCQFQGCAKKAVFAYSMVGGNGAKDLVVKRVLRKGQFFAKHMKEVANANVAVV